MNVEVVRIEKRGDLEVTVYSNGMERANGRIIKPPQTSLITKENASEFHRARKEKRRSVFVESANSAVKKQEFREKYGEFAYIAATAESAMTKAQNPADPKAVEAMRFVHENAKDIDEETDERRAVPSRVVLLLAELARRGDSEEVIDAALDDV